jgi:hypothetical protein
MQQARAQGPPLVRRCARQYARYTCPRCNLAYCALACYKQHSESCTSQFHKEHAAGELQGVRAEDGDKRAMQEILRRVAEQQREDEEAQRPLLEAAMQGLSLEAVLVGRNVERAPARTCTLTLSALRVPFRCRGAACPHSSQTSCSDPQQGMDESEDSLVGGDALSDEGDSEDGSSDAEWHDDAAARSDGSAGPSGRRLHALRQLTAVLGEDTVERLLSKVKRRGVRRAAAARAVVSAARGGEQEARRPGVRSPAREPPPRMFPARAPPNPLFTHDAPGGTLWRSVRGGSAGLEPRAMGGLLARRGQRPGASRPQFSQHPVKRLALPACVQQHARCADMPCVVSAPGQCCAC